MRKYAMLLKLLYIPRRFASQQCKTKISSSDLLKLADKHIVNTSDSIFPIVVSKGKGASVYDVEGNEYMDFISGHVGAILGHSHPKVCKAIAEQAWQLTNTPRSLYTKILIDFGQYITNFFCYDKVLPMNSDSEAIDAAIAIAKKWACKAKGIEEDKARVVIPDNSSLIKDQNIAACLKDGESLFNEGPEMPGFEIVPYSDARALELKLRDPNICAFLFEPIQTKLGIQIPDACYLKQVREMCCRHKVLMIADETECGLGVAGCWLCCNIYNVRADILILGKALAAGFTPMAVVLGEDSVMSLVTPGMISTSLGTNPLGCKTSLATLGALHEEKLVENAKEMGELFRGSLCDLPRDVVCEVKGVGLLNSIEFASGISAWNISCDLMRNGLLVNPVSESTIRISPPLIIREKHVTKATRIIRRTIENSRGNCANTNEIREPSKRKISHSFNDILKCAKNCLKKPEKREKICEKKECETQEKNDCERNECEKNDCEKNDCERQECDRQEHGRNICDKKDHGRNICDRREHGRSICDRKNNGRNACERRECEKDDTDC